LLTLDSAQRCVQPALAVGFRFGAPLGIVTGEPLGDPRNASPKVERFPQLKVQRP
jgi:hypothetical protein